MLFGKPECLRKKVLRGRTFANKKAVRNVLINLPENARVFYRVNSFFPQGAMDSRE
jgi:hypothetical protein